MNKQKGFSAILVLILIVLATIGGAYYYKAESGKMCGGFAGNLPERQCAPGFRCKYDGFYPDASGQCTIVTPDLFFLSKKPKPSVAPLTPGDSGYSCPATEYINCMPIITHERQKLCDKDYLAWAKANCPNFKGATY